jgi:tRNA modification GTPase
LPAPDTIVAVSTAAGRSARSVVRMSGPGALVCAAARFEPDVGGRPWDLSYSVTAGSLRLARAGTSVPALLYVMRGPRSYTREDVVEAHLPGSPALLDLVLDDLVSRGPGGLRLAEPGEFTRRAFMNGRLDLARAEAVLAVIRARSESELLAAGARLRGSVGRLCARFQTGIAEMRVQAEAALDFAEEGIELMRPEEFAARCAALRERMEAEAAAGRQEIAADGKVHVVICGAPNAGKSSLLNRLAGAEHAIVNPSAGTTRDPVGAEVELGGVFFRLTDTAGLSGSATGANSSCSCWTGRRRCPTAC